MTRKQVERHDKICIMILAILAVVFVVQVVAATAKSDKKKENEMQQVHPIETQEATISHPKEPEIVTQGAEPEKNPEKETESRYAIFDCMSEDWGSEDVIGFVYYELPEEYADTGYFPEKMQIYTRCLCKQYNVPYALVLAMIEYESGYVFDATGDNGNSKGYMQIYEKFHADRMKKLGVNDLMNPYHNVCVGIDYIAELLEKYGNVQDALAAYNYGETGAREHLWNNGIYVYKYNRTIMERMKEIEEVVGSGI